MNEWLLERWCRQRSALILTCATVTLSTTNSTRPHMRSNPGLRGNSPATEDFNCVTAHRDLLQRTFKNFIVGEGR